MGVGQKIKDVLTPGHHHQGQEGTTEGDYNTQTGNMTSGYGTTGTGTGTGYGTSGSGQYSTINQGDVGTETGYGKEGYGQERYGQEGYTGAMNTNEGDTYDAGTGGAVCGQERFTKTEDRPIIREQRTYVKEHRPVEKEFVVETRPTGVERQMEGETEYLGTGERIVSEAMPKSPCD